LQSTAGRDKHIDLVQKGIDAIKTGEFKKVVLSRKEVVQVIKS
jgi:isochorismate synthase